MKPTQLIALILAAGTLTAMAAVWHLGSTEITTDSVVVLPARSPRVRAVIRIQGTNTVYYARSNVVTLATGIPLNGAPSGNDGDGGDVLRFGAPDDPYNGPVAMITSNGEAVAKWEELY